MYDEYTTSNVESEHAAIKSKGVGLLANNKVTTMFEKTDLNATKRYHQRTIFQNKDMMCTNVDTKCQASKVFVKSCYIQLLKLIDLSTRCISKQVDGHHWIVIYNNKDDYNCNHTLHFLPKIKRQRYVTLTSGT